MCEVDGFTYLFATLGVAFAVLACAGVPVVCLLARWTKIGLGDFYPTPSPPPLPPHGFIDRRD